MKPTCFSLTVVTMLFAAAPSWAVSPGGIDIPDRPAQPEDATQDYYCALAYSPRTGRAGYCWKAASREDAQHYALLEVGTKDARILTWCKNGYIAFARSYRGKGYGFAWDMDSHEAGKKALKFCRQKNSSAYLAFCIGGRPS